MKNQIQLKLFEDTSILPTGKYHISYSELACFEECSYSHNLKHVRKLDEFTGSIHTAFGNAIHTALEKYSLTKKPPSVDECEKDFKERLEKFLFTDEEVSSKDAEEFIAAIPDMLGQVPEFLDSNFPGWKLVSAEEKLFEPIRNQKNRWFKGFIDLVIKVPKKKTKKNKDLNEYIYYILDWKGQRLNAPILTPDGWTTMGELKIGQNITSSNGKSCKVTGIFPLGTRDVYRVTLRDGSYVDVTEDHLWPVESTYKSNKTGTYRRKILPTTEIMNQKYKYLPVLSGPVEYNKKNDLPINPYVLGLLLGDGSFSGSVRFTTVDKTLLEEIIRLSPKTWSLGYVSTDKNRTPTYIIKNAFADIRKLGLYKHRSHEKFIPDMYMYSNPKQRLGILQGLLDTDGWVQKGIPKLSTTSEHMANNVKHLACSLGGNAFICTRKKKRTETEKTEFIVTVKLPLGIKPFRLKRKLKKWNPKPKNVLRRKIEKIEKIGTDKMQCISVSSKDSLYVTKDFILTHNTTSWGWQKSQKMSPIKQMQLILYKKFWCQKTGVDIKNTRVGWVFLKRKPKKDGSRVELLLVSAGPKAIARATERLNVILNQIKQKRFSKNKRSCMWCKFAGTELCP